MRKTEKQIMNVILETMVKVGVKPGGPDFLEHMKEAIWKVHMILGTEPCDRECEKCTNPDCPIQKYK